MCHSEKVWPISLANPEVCDRGRSSWEVFEVVDERRCGRDRFFSVLLGAPKIDCHVGVESGRPADTIVGAVRLPPV